MPDSLLTRISAFSPARRKWAQMATNENSTSLWYGVESEHHALFLFPTRLATLKGRAGGVSSWCELVERKARQKQGKVISRTSCPCTLFDLSHYAFTTVHWNRNLFKVYVVIREGVFDRNLGILLPLQPRARTAPKIEENTDCLAEPPTAG